VNALIPLKGFDVGKLRMAGQLAPDVRASLARHTAEHVVSACRTGGLDVTIVSGSDEIARWANSHDLQTVPDPDLGLDAACAAGVEAIGSKWVVVHGDLPLLDQAAVEFTADQLAAGRGLIAPSRDGGTNLLGGVAPDAFAYGTGSFHRHLAAFATPPVVLVSMPTLIELDTPQDLSAAAVLPGGGWLGRFLS